ncbi:MAG: TAXI family TRAP transporter solute-binding subunit [Candidatus Midichloriaceae bacterium]
MIKLKIKSLFILLSILVLSTGKSYAIEKPQNPFEEKQSINKDKAQVKITTDKNIKKQEFFNPKTITIATDYSNNSVGKVICSLVNYNQHITGFNCMTKPTSGSLENIDKLNKGEVDFAIAPASIIFDKIQNNTDKNSVDKNQRFVLSLNAEVLNIMVKNNSKIKNIDDFKNTIIDVGSKDSATYIFLQKILEQKKWTNHDLSGVEYIKYTDKANALCSNKVNATFIYGGIPDIYVNDITNFCEVRLISIDNRLINDMSLSNYFIDEKLIPGGSYLGNPINIDTFGSPTLIISSSNFDKLTVYNLVKLIVNNINTLKKIHSAFDISPLKEIADNKNQIPYHEGSAILFQERNLTYQ